MAMPCNVQSLAAYPVLHGRQVGAAAMAGQYRYLLRHLSRYSARLAAMDDAQLIALLKSRLAPIKA